MTADRMRASGDASGTNVTREPTDVIVLAAQIRSAIVNGIFHPNEHLVEGQLAHQFSTSRAAVRAALIELAGEGLIEREANRGARVRAVQWQEAIEICEVQRLLEGLCAAKAAENITEDAANELKSLIDQMEAAVRIDDVAAYSRVSWILHNQIREASCHQTASDLVHRLRNQSMRYHFQLSFIPGRAASSLEEHRAVVEAIVAHDPERAQRAARAHVDSSAKTMMSIARSPLQQLIPIS